MSSMLTVYLEDTNKLLGNINECKRMGIPLLPPDVNQSQLGFSVQMEGGKKGIRFGLLAIKNLGKHWLEGLLEERAVSGPFESFASFCGRMSKREITSRGLESLIRAGAMDHLGLNRCQMIAMVDTVLPAFSKERSSKPSGQMGLFDASPELEEPEFAVPPLAEYEKHQLLAMEKEVTGLYLSGHPLEEVGDLVKELDSKPLVQLLEASESLDGSKIALLALISARKNRVTKAGTQMANLILEDQTASLEATLFPKQFLKLGSLAKEGEVLLLCGRLQVREESVSLVLEEILPPNKESLPLAKKYLGAGQNKATPHPPTPEGTLFCRMPSAESYLKIAHLISTHPGKIQTAFFYENENQAGEKKYDYQPKALWVDGSKELLEGLISILGEKNVVLRVKK